MTDSEIAMAYRELMSGRGRLFSIKYESGYDNRDSVRRALGIRASKYTGSPRYVIKRNNADWALVLTEQENGSYTPSVERL